jgi:hypothetical protein
MHKAPNPFKLLALLNFQQWMFFLVAFIAWTWDAFDFFTVSLTVTDLAETFDKTNADMWVASIYNCLLQLTYHIIVLGVLHLYLCCDLLARSFSGSPQIVGDEK